MTLPPIEGLWYGPDKVAHFLVPLAITGWWMIFRPRQYAWGPIVGVFLGLLWEMSNALIVIEGRPGVSLIDGLSFMAGGVASGVLALIAHARGKQ